MNEHNSKIIEMCASIIADISCITQAASETDDGGLRYSDGDMYDMCCDNHINIINTLTDIIKLMLEERK